MEETNSEYLKVLRESVEANQEESNEEMDSEVSSEYAEKCKAFAKFILENGCKQQGEDEEDD